MQIKKGTERFVKLKKFFSDSIIVTCNLDNALHVVWCVHTDRHRRRLSTPILMESIQLCKIVHRAILVPIGYTHYRPQGKIMFSQASVILSTISLMTTRPLLILVGYSVTVMARSVCVLLEYFLVLSVSIWISVLVSDNVKTPVDIFCCWISLASCGFSGITLANDSNFQKVFFIQFESVNPELKYTS